MKIKVNVDANAKKLQVIRLLGVRGLDRCAKTLHTIGNESVNYAVRQYRSSKTTTATKTRRRSGALAGSYKAGLPETKARTVTMDWGIVQPEKKEVLEYAGVHEARTPTPPIKPKEGRKWLTIPLKGIMTPMGVARIRLRDIDRTAWFVPRFGKFSYASGKPIVFLKRQGFYGRYASKYARGAKGAIPIFRLVKEVTVPPRPAIEPTWERYLPILQKRIKSDLLDEARTQ